MNVGDPSLLTQPLEVITNTMEPDPSASKRKSKLKKANRHLAKSVLETMSATNDDTVGSPMGAKKTPLCLTDTPSSIKQTTMNLTIDLTESSPPPAAPKITPGSTRVESESTMPASSYNHLKSSPSYKENEVIVVSNKDTNLVDGATPKPQPASSKTFSAAKPATSDNDVNPTISSATNTKEPAPQKKKKQSFHDKILYTMLTSCKPYTLKSLAQATDTTVEALRHAMLSFLDKNLVLSKEFPSKSSGREPKTLYWANPIRLSEEVVETGDRGGKKSSGSGGGGGAVIKELSKLLATQQEIQEANATRQQLQEQYRAMQDELNPLLAMPTVKQLDEEIVAAEEKLRHVKSEIAAAKDRITAQGPPPSSTISTQPQQSKPQNPTILKRKINHMLGEYKTRKRKCMDFVEELSDAMEKTTKDVVGEKILCLDTDEME